MKTAFNASKWISFLVFAITLKAHAIFGGVEVKADSPESRSVVLLMAQDENLNPCTAVFVSSKALLTAAHCVTHGSKIKNQIKLYQLLDGRSLLRQTSGAFIKPKSISIDEDQVTVHESYFQKDNPEKIDLALILLKGNVSNALPVPILNLTLESLPPQLMAIGYGQGVAPNETPSHVLRKVMLTKIQDQDSVHFEVDQTQNKGICRGDSGGPGLVNVNGQVALAGIAIEALNERGRQDCTWAGVYLKINPVIEWIQKRVPDIKVIE